MTDVAESEAELSAKIDAAIKKIGDPEADYTSLDPFLEAWEEVVASAFWLGRPNLVEGLDLNIPRLMFPCGSLAHTSIRNLIRTRLVTVLDRLEDPPLAADPISFSDIAALAGVTKKAVQNYAIEWRKELGRETLPQICSYATARPLLLKQWPDKHLMFPENYKEMREILAIRRESSSLSTTV